MSSKEIIRVYVAGKYSAGNVIDVLENMRRGMQIGVEVLAAGFAPFVPWFDYHFTLMRPDGAVVGIDEYYRYSMAWLEASHCILVISGEKDSTGVQNEIARAKELGLPIFYTIDELKEYYKDVLPQPVNLYVDPWDDIRKEHWEHVKDNTWRCNKHGIEFIITEDYCSNCLSEMEVDRLGEEVIIDEDDFDEEDEMDEEG